MSENPYEPPSVAGQQQVPSYSSGSFDPVEDLDVFYCDSSRFTAPLRFMAFTDRGFLGFGSKGGADFCGRKVTLRAVDYDSMCLVRPPFAYLQFLFVVGMVLSYQLVYVFPSGDVLRIWFGGVSSLISTLLMIRLLTVPWLEVTQVVDGRLVKHYFFNAERFGWSGLLGGNSKLLSYFQQ